MSTIIGNIVTVNGAVSVLGALAYKDSASGSFTPNGSVTISKGSGTANYTPQGSVTAPTISVKTAGATTTVNSITSVGTLPRMTMTIVDETLRFGFDTGTLPTRGTNVTVKTGDAAYKASAPAFTGTGAELKASFSGISGNVSVS